MPLNEKKKKIKPLIKNIKAMNFNFNFFYTFIQIDIRN